MKISVDRFSTDNEADQLTLITLTNAEAIFRGGGMSKD
jgi:hypothetical protein